MAGWMDGWIDGWIIGWLFESMDGWMDECGLQSLTDTAFFYVPQIPVASDQTAIDTCKAKVAPLEVEDLNGSLPFLQLFILCPSSSSPSSIAALSPSRALQWGWWSSFSPQGEGEGVLLLPVANGKQKSQWRDEYCKCMQRSGWIDTRGASETNRVITGRREPPWLIIPQRSTRITFYHLEINLTRCWRVFSLFVCLFLF